MTQTQIRTQRKYLEAQRKALEAHQDTAK